jgi:hypothetical protein
LWRVRFDGPKRCHRTTLAENNSATKAIIERATPEGSAFALMLVPKCGFGTSADD